MDNMFDDLGAADAFALPGDESLLARLASAAEPEPDAAEPAEEAGPGGPLRDPDGRFAARPADEPAEPTTADVATVEPAVDSLDDVYAKFGIDPATADEAALKLARSYAEQEQLKGRQSSEIGELRALLANQPDDAADTDAADPADGYDAEQLQGWLAANPDEILPAIGQAIQSDDSTLLAHGLVALDAVDPVRAEAIRIELARTQPAPAAVDPESQQQAESKLAMAAAHDPGLSAFLQSPEIGALAQQFPTAATMIQQGTPEQKVEAILTLRELHKGQQNERLVMTQRQVARATAVEAQQVRDEAFVASAETASAGVKPSKADQIAAEWDAIEAPYRDGWNL